MKYSGETSEKVVKKRLASALIAHQPDVNPETLQRKVRDWARTAERSIDKDTAFEICFALKLTVDQADHFLAEITDEGLHWRDPQEMIRIFGLDQGMAYPEVCALCERISDMKFDADRTQNISAETMTAVIRDEFSQIRSVDELISYILEEQGRLGHLHQTAYHMFDQMMKLLMSPDKMTEEEAEELRRSRTERGIDAASALDPVLQYDLEKKMTAREVLEVYLYRRHVPYLTKKVGKSSSIEQLIARNWPSGKELSQIKTRTVDVSRKTLMLLFLATDGITNLSDDDFAYDDEEDFWENDELFEEDEFESSVVRLNTMLSECGMRLLDPRVPFDWMILYCMCSSDELTRDTQVQQFLDMLYTNGNSGDEA